MTKYRIMAVKGHIKSNPYFGYWVQKQIFKLFWIDCYGSKEFTKDEMDCKQYINNQKLYEKLVIEKGYKKDTCIGEY